MNRENKDYFIRGFRNGLPIGAGYFAVSFTLGIVMRNAGLTPIEGMVMSLLNNTSAGQVAGTEIIAENGSYFEIALSQLIINLRYLLMSAALAPAVTSKMKTLPRLFVSFDITDEVFALLIMQKRPLSEFFSFGVALASIPFWAAGTFLGILFGNILPADVTSALSVALYAMFIAVIIPPAKKNLKLLILIVISMLISYLFTLIPYLKEISQGMKIIVLTVLISTVAALVIPLKEEGRDAT